MMRLVLILFTFSLIGCVTSGTKFDIRSEQYYIARCKIYDKDLNPFRQLSGDECLPLPDGTWISFSQTNLTKYNIIGEVEWSKSGFFHHQIKLSPDQSHLYVLSAHAENYKTKNIKFDTVQKYDLQGNLVAEFDLFKEIYEKKTLIHPYFKNDLNPVVNLEKIFPGTNYELLHLNAINFLEDDLVIGAATLIVFILDKDLKFKRADTDYSRFYFEKICPRGGCGQTQHDYQILPNGNNLFFKNAQASSDPGKKTFKIYEYKNNDIVFEFPVNPEDEFDNDFCGGVQKLDEEHYLVGFPLKGRIESIIGIVNKKNGWILKKNIPESIQDIKYIPYKNYFSNNKFH